VHNAESLSRKAPLSWEHISTPTLPNPSSAPQTSHIHPPSWKSSVNTKHPSVHCAVKHMLVICKLGPLGTNTTLNSVDGVSVEHHPQKPSPLPSDCFTQPEDSTNRWIVNRLSPI